LRKLLFGERVRGIDLKNSGELRLCRLVVQLFESPPAGFEVLKRGVVACLLVLQPVFGITGFSVEGRLVLSHCRIEVPLELSPAATAVGLACGASGKADC